MRGLRVWCDTQVCESRHLANVVDNVYHVYAKRFLLSLNLLLKMSQRRRLSADNMNRAIGMLQAGCDQRQRQVATSLRVSYPECGIAFRH